MKRRAAVLLTLALCALPALTACGGDEDPAVEEELTPKVITITVKDGTIDPNGERVDVAVDQPIELQVDSDAEGELHVHSDPEQELSYGVGQTKLEVDAITMPGVVEIEDHTLDKVVVQLQVQ
ncbi:hypothetical protein [Nocardioides taihuensis]|uniref:Lipoprotein n=1 Tax=Nocardioides taihuensis TaxID=1835606 RepID=A0ABW0BKJ3_9ACTN